MAEANDTQISEIQKRVHKLKEDCERQVSSHRKRIQKNNSKIKTTKKDIPYLEDKINFENEGAADCDGCANDLNGQAEYLEETLVKKKKQRRSGARINVIDLGNCIREADALRNAKLGTANSLEDDVTRKKSYIDRLETEIVSLKERIGVLNDAIRILGDVEKMLRLSSVGVSGNVMAAIQETETLLKETLLARSGSVTVLYTRERRAVESKLENLKASLMRLQTAMKKSGKKALHN